MNRIRWLLVGLLVAEFAVGGWLVAARQAQPGPPVPDLTAVDPVTAAEIRAAVANCRTTEQWTRLGEIYLATGFFPEAEACLRTASALDRTDGPLAFKHAFALERLGKLEEANARYEAAAARRYRPADCWYYVGKNHLRLEREEPAAATFERAGGLPAARYELALLAARHGRPEAETAAERLSVKFPAAYPPVSLRYRLALARNDRTAADSLADLFPRQSKTLPVPFDTEVDWVFGVANRVGQSRLFREASREAQAGRLDRADAKLRSALDAGWNPEIADKLGDILFLLGRRQEAIDVLTEAVTRGRASVELLGRLGQAQAALGREAVAVELWERAGRLTTGPGGKELWEDLANQYNRAGRKDRAKLLRAREFLAAGVELLDGGQFGDAVRALTEATGHDPSLARAWYYLGEAERASGHPTEACAAYERCLQLDADHGRTRRALKRLQG